jgi:FixJ family two-component response regulator
MTAGLVHIVDDDPAIRSAVSRLLRAHGRQVETYSSAEDFLDRKVPSVPACIVLDLQMPGIGGLELQQFLIRNRETLPIVFLSGHGSILTSVSAMKHGAVDFLTKPFDEQQLISAVDAALDRAQRAYARRDALERDRAAFGTLTQRERQVCLRVAEGMLNKQIGSEFGTTEKTIKAQRGKAMQKLGIQSVTDLVRLVERLHPSEQSAHPATLPEELSRKQAVRTLSSASSAS